MRIFKKGEASNREQIIVARVATLLLGAVSIFLGIVFKKQNVAFMVGLAFTVAASSNFPALILTTFWRRATTAGIVSSMVVGTVSSLILIYFSPSVQIDILGHSAALFPLKTPGLVAIPLSFGTAILVSLCTQDIHARDRFSWVKKQVHLGDFSSKHREIVYGEPSQVVLNTRSKEEESKLNKVSGEADRTFLMEEPGDSFSAVPALPHKA